MLSEEKYLARDPGTGILKGAWPFSFPAEGAEKAVLLIHGFTGTPYEVRPLGEYLSGRGIAAYGPLLAGHGTHVNDLLKTSWRDWEAGPEKQLDELLKKYPKVYIAGFSMGGDIAVDLAARYKVAGVILLAPCLYIYGQDKFITPEHSIKYISRFLLTDYIVKKRNNGAFDPEAVKGRPAYALFPIKGLRDLVELEELVRPEIPKVDEPLLVIQSVNDDTVDRSGPGYIMRHAGSKDREVLWVERSKHLLALDAEKERVFSKVYEFILKH